MKAFFGLLALIYVYEVIRWIVMLMWKQSQDN